MFLAWKDLDQILAEPGNFLSAQPQAKAVFTLGRTEWILIFSLFPANLLLALVSVPERLGRFAFS
jgi:hypothetical protein